MKKLVRLMTITLLASAFSQPLFAAEDKTIASATPATSTATTPSTGAGMDTTAATPSTTTSATTNGVKAGKMVSVSNLLQQLQKAGYIVKTVDYSKDDGQFKVDAIDKNGDKQSLEINASTGLTADQKKISHNAPVVMIIKKLEKNGAYVKSLSMDSGTYKVTVVDNKGNEQDYTIDMVSGKVSQ